MRDLSCRSHRVPSRQTTIGVVRIWLTPLLVALVTLPIVAYLAGALVASPDDPAPRSPVILRDADPSLTALTMTALAVARGTTTVRSLS